jgi:molecular chaperone DnaK (HSP70)
LHEQVSPIGWFAEEVAALPYVLGVDVGSSNTAAAICRVGGSGRAVELVQLGATGPVASVLQLTDEGTFVVGDDQPVDHRRAARGFIRRIGDEVPYVLGNELCTAQELTALMVMWVAGQVAARQGEPALHVVITHPAGWGAYRKGVLLEALRAVGIGNVTLLPEPLAAAENHAARDRVPVGAALGVYSSGNQGFACSVVRRRPDRTFEVVTSTEVPEQPAGAEFDDALVEQVLGRRLAELDPADPRARRLMAALRRECSSVKAVLSGAAEVTIPVLDDQIRLRRADFEGLIRQAVEHSVAELVRTVEGVPLDAVVMVGGSTRIPLVTELVSGAVQCRVLAESAPETSVVKGAALAARLLVEGPEPEAEPIETSVLERTSEASLRFPVGALEVADDESAAPPPRPPVDISPLDLPERPSVKRVVKALSNAPGASRRSDTHDEDGR